MRESNPCSKLDELLSSYINHPKMDINQNQMTETSSYYNNLFSLVGNLIKLLPAGTVCFFHFFSPLLSNNGRCHSSVNKYLTAVLVAVCGISCIVSSFTDSFSGSNGVTRYGFITAKGLWPSGASSSSAYRLRFGDFVRAFLSLAVFVVLSILDPNVVSCFYPSWETSVEALLTAAPPVVGVVASFIFVLFPGNRNGVGCPSASSAATTTSSGRVSSGNV